MNHLPKTLLLVPPARHHKPRPKKDPLNPRSYLWQMIFSYMARGSMPSWGLPFETIVASILLRDRGDDKEPPEDGDI